MSRRPGQRTAGHRPKTFVDQRFLCHTVLPGQLPSLTSNRSDLTDRAKSRTPGSAPGDGDVRTISQLRFDLYRDLVRWIPLPDAVRRLMTEMNDQVAEALTSPLMPDRDNPRLNRPQPT